MIGPYRVEREIARGGMGIVYLAHDTRLDRTVALKALPPDVAADPERLGRFEREAKLLASLNHPNIGAIYDVVESEGRRYLALEHIEGETLAQRLSRGALSIPEAIDLCVQIAAGMEAAHERGVIHRDLKPGNVMITPGDRVKIVDFGLAKGRVTPDSAIVDSPTVPTSSPTITSPALSPGTIPGVILGTAPYLSPEQARGKPVDRRTDIWSWGCILYECLAGRMAFHGETVSDTIAKILERDPDWSLLPRTTPDRVRELLERCLEKDSRRRLRDIGDACVSLERARDTSAFSARVPTRKAGRATGMPSRKTAFTLGLLLLAFSAGTILGSRAWSPGFDAAAARLTLSFPENLDVSGWDMTPDGSALVMRASERGTDSTADGRVSRLYVRPFDSYDVRVLPGTENTYAAPVMTRDSRDALFVTATSYASVNRTLARVALDGRSPAVKVTAWDPDWSMTMAPYRGDILVTKNGNELIRIPGSGGTPVSLGRIQSDDSTASFEPAHGQVVLRDNSVLFKCTTFDSLGYHVGAASVDLRTHRARILLRDGDNPVLSPTGHLLFMRGDALLGVRCDTHGSPKGTAVGLVQGIRAPGSWIVLAGNGTLVYMPGGRVSEQRHLVLLERDGSVVPWSDDRRRFAGSHAVSHDGSRAAVEVVNGNLGELWIADIPHHELSRTFAATTASFSYPALSPDGSRIVFRRVSDDSTNGVWLARTDGTGEMVRLLSSPTDQSVRYYPLGWTADGSTVYLDKWIGSRAGLARIRVAPAPDSAVEDLFRRQDSQAMGGTPSPDGRWVLFQWDQTGRARMYAAEVRPDGSLGGPFQVSHRDAAAPHWSSDGRTGYWFEGGQVVAAPFNPSSGRFSDIRGAAFDSRLMIKDYVPLPGGRFFAVQGVREETSSAKEVSVVFHWTHELDRAMSAAGR